VLLSFNGGVRLAAQTTGILEGLVFDPSGSVVPGAAVAIVDLEMGASRSVSTDPRGRYQALSLFPGSYRIEVSHPGFRGEIRQPVDLTAGGVVQVDFRLVIGEPQEQIVVEAEMPLLSTRTSDWGGSITSQKLEDFPLKGRDMFDLAAQTPGASVPTTAKVDLDTGLGIHMSVNGSRPNQNSFRMDGIYINDATSTAPASAAGGLLGIEGVSELRIVSSPFSAEYGSAGAQITAVSRSGSNQWHGSAYEFPRNSWMDAKNYFDPAGGETPPLRRNQFGGSLGGPIRANRIFFFTNYEGIRSSSSKTQSSNTMTEQARQGILPTASGVRVVNVAPEVEPYLDLYPLPNGRDFGDGTGEFQSEVATHSREDMLSGRVDYNYSEKLRVFGRYTFDDAETSTTDPFMIWTFPSDSRYQFFQAEAQYLPSSRTIHAFRFGFSRVRNSDFSQVREDIPLSLSFVPGQSLGAIDITGVTPLGGLTARLRPRQFVTNNYQFNYDGTTILGVHTLRFGGSYERIQFNQRSDNNAIGRYSFTSLSDFLEAKTNYGDLMLPDSDTIRGWRHSQFAGFIQDEYRISKNLSGTLGVRYEGYTVPYEVNGKVATIPDPLHDNAVTVGGPLFINPSGKNFAPRAAVAWDPFGRGQTVIRAGAGIFFDLLGMRELTVSGARMPPFYSRATTKRPAFPDLLEAIQNTSPEIVPDSVDFRPNQPYTVQYQFSIEQKVSASYVIRGSYAGARGAHLPAQVGNINPPVPDLLEDGSLYFPQNSPRLNPAFGRINMRRMQFNSFHHAFHAELQGRWSNRWSLQVKYTWAKTIDESSSATYRDFAGSDLVPTMFDYRQNRGLSDFDVRHLVAANSSLRLPDWGSGIYGHVLRGWELYGLMQVQTGYAFSPTVGFDRARINPGSEDLGQRPDLIAAAGTELILGEPQKYFDDLAFALPPAGKYGNLGRNALTGPGRVTVDLALHKDIWGNERHNVRLRIETFNIPNHPNFQIPSGLALFNSSFQRLGTAGRITSTSTPSRQIQLALKWTF
jgi:hypothetical protein